MVSAASIQKESPRIRVSVDIRCYDDRWNIHALHHRGFRFSFVDGKQGREKEEDAMKNENKWRNI
jgi:hypothetical protein